MRPLRAAVVIAFLVFVLMAGTAGLWLGFGNSRDPGDPSWLALVIVIVTLMLIALSRWVLRDDSRRE